MATNPKHLNKLAPTAPKPLTEDEKAQQIARFFSQKREQYFQLILANIIRANYRGEGLNIFIDLALEAADHAVEKLYPLPAEPKQEEAK